MEKYSRRIRGFVEAFPNESINKLLVFAKPENGYQSLCDPLIATYYKTPEALEHRDMRYHYPCTISTVHVHPAFQFWMHQLCALIIWFVCFLGRIFSEHFNMCHHITHELLKCPDWIQHLYFSVYIDLHVHD